MKFKKKQETELNKFNSFNWLEKEAAFENLVKKGLINIYWNDKEGCYMVQLTEKGLQEAKNIKNG